MKIHRGAEEHKYQNKNDNCDPVYNFEDLVCASEEMNIT